MTEDPGTRLRKLRERRGFETAADAARAYGWPVTTYQAHENGSRGLKLDVAQRYARAFGSSAAFILTGNDGGGASAVVNHVTYVPVVAAASAGAFMLEEGIFEDITVPAVPRPDIPAAVQYAIRVDGPSVNLRIPDGAYAICAPLDKTPGGARHGQLVHVVRERAGLHETTIKELHYTSKGPALMPVSNDPRYQEVVEIGAPEADTEVRIAGVVIGMFQPL